MNRSLTHALTATLVATLALAIACEPPPAKDPGDKPADTPKVDEPQPVASGGTGPIAKVNGKTIDRAGFDKQMARTRSRFERAGREIKPQLETRLKENLIRKLVDDELIRQKSEAEGIKVTDEDLTAKFDDHKKRFGSEQSFESFKKRTNQNEEDIKRDLRKNLMREKLFEKLMSDSTPGEDEAQKYFAENKEKYKMRESVRASHILFKVAKNAPAADKQAQKKKADDVLKKVKAKGAKFDELAREFSEGPTKSRGGDLGLFSRGRMVKEFEAAAFAAKAGQIVGPVETQFGYHIIKIFEKKPARQREYDEVKDSILTSLKARAKSKATREILATLKKDAKVEILEKGVSLARKVPVNSATKKPMVSEKDLAKIQEAAQKAAADAHKAQGAAKKEAGNK